MNLKIGNRDQEQKIYAYLCGSNCFQNAINTDQDHMSMIITKSGY